MLAKDITARLAKLGVTVTAQPDITAVLDLYKERAQTLNELAEAIAYFYREPVVDLAAAEKHLTPEIKPVLAALIESLQAIEWHAEHIHHAIDAAVTQNQLKFPKVAMPLRVALTGIAQSPSIDQVMALLGKDVVLNRLKQVI